MIATAGDLRLTNSSKVTVSGNSLIGQSKGTVKVNFTQNDKKKTIIKLKIKK